MCGGHSHGQGHATTFAQIAAEMLGCDINSVDIVEGDTDRTPFGLGTFGSRTLLVVGIAITRAVDKVIAKGAKIAAHLMECDEKDVVFEAGRYTIAGTNQSVDFTEVVKAAYLVENYPEDLEPGLEETAFYDPPGRATTSGIHLCVVLVDPTDGTIRLRDYWSIDDVGRAINPMVVEGQLHGGIVQGLGQVLMEKLCLRRVGTAPDRYLHGLRDAARGGCAVVRYRIPGNLESRQPARRQGGGGERCHRTTAGRG